MATPAPVEVTREWELLAATGYQWLIEIHDGHDAILIAFDTEEPGADVEGHKVKSGDVVTPPTGEAIYGRSVQGVSRVTVSRGNAA